MKLGKDGEYRRQSKSVVLIPFVIFMIRFALFMIRLSCFEFDFFFFCFVFFLVFFLFFVRSLFSALKRWRSWVRSWGFYRREARKFDRNYCRCCGLGVLGVHGCCRLPGGLKLLVAPPFKETS